MTTARCPACGASVAAGAPWCTLCYADLRQPAAVAAAAAPAAEPAPAPAVVLPPDPFLDAPIMVRADAGLIPPAHAAPAVAAAAPAWPCPRCAASVPLDQDSCPGCGAPFLGGSDALPAISLPGVGDVRRLDRAGKVMLCVGGALGVCVVLVLLATMLGALL